MNVVLDLNGLLCVTEDSKSKEPSQRMQPLLEPWFVTIRAKVGPKVVFVRCKWFIFLRELLRLAFVSFGIL